MRSSQLPQEVPCHSVRLSSQPDKPQRNLCPQNLCAPHTVLCLSGAEPGSLLAVLRAPAVSWGPLQGSVWYFINFLHLPSTISMNTCYWIWCWGYSGTRRSSSGPCKHIFPNVEWRPFKLNDFSDKCAVTSGISAGHERPMRLQEHTIGISPIRKFKGGCPKVVITELDLRGNRDYERVNWRKSSGQEGTVWPVTTWI